ncbi:TPA: ABC transporter permease [Candidatus Bipolaricaulota bacterium]|nr:ABC transporter permease [Candidatus Bipolaricaulota bacterium]HIP99202.1 ABC transporter permease [Candidatus Bipolaricaulota bacterium]
MRRLGLKLGLGCVSLSLGLVLVGFLWLPADPLEMTAARFAPPSFAHPMGTDWFGRDVLARLLVGGRISLGAALAAVSLGAVAGTLLGGLAGYYGGLLDELIMRSADFLLVFPPLLLALFLAVLVGPGPWGIVIAIGIFNVPYFGRLTRGGLLSLREREFVLAARAVGAGDLRVLVRHILPHLLSPLLVQFTVSLGMALLAEAAFSYLGLGTPPPAPTWGRMLREAQSYFRHSPWPAVFPGLFLSLTVLGLNLVGDGLRDLLDPSLRGFSPR